MNPDITQANIQQTICNPNWATKTIRPPVSYTNGLKTQQLTAPRYTDKVPSHYEEDHFISLELGGNPRDPKNLWPEMWGTLDQPLTSRGPFPAHLVGAKSKDAVENQLHKEVCAGTLTVARGPAHHLHRLVQVLPGQRVEVGSIHGPRQGGESSLTSHGTGVSSSPLSAALHLPFRGTVQVSLA